jgi:hypothetical protein
MSEELNNSESNTNDAAPTGWETLENMASTPDISSSEPGGYLEDRAIDIERARQEAEKGLEDEIGRAINPIAYEWSRRFAGGLSEESRYAYRKSAYKRLGYTDTPSENEEEDGLSAADIMNMECWSESMRKEVANAAISQALEMIKQKMSQIGQELSGNNT